MNKSLKVLEYAMEMEKQGREFYLRNKDLVADSNSKELFSQLAEIENEHYKLLSDSYEKLSNIEGNVDLDLKSGFEIFNKELNNSDINFDSLSGSDLAIMRMAYIIENDFAEFYKNAAKTAEDPNVKMLLEDLSKWENQHREIFYSQFQDMMKENWFKQNFYPF